MRDRALDLISLIEMEMRQHGLWSDVEPSAEALASTQPFAVDTLDFEQWVQFIYLPKLTVLIQVGNVPHNVSVCPMAEEAWRHHGDKVMVLLDRIADLDELLSGKRVRE
ncbi:YqcC family protein [Gallaecimonas kandeliae]|uniref:YqcC family protein n=1 Tax=Gallaecimonas kandeliae TaxID=3029055 RepID=UPI0026472A3C|nr:YqcC family protein [Gallaecimonas kandeliae]WKE64534.1 YqcC family protein [Gallaecimonas kandeliae]